MKPPPRTIAGILGSLEGHEKNSFMAAIREVDLLDPIAVLLVVDPWRQKIFHGKLPAKRRKNYNLPTSTAPGPVDSSVSGFLMSMNELKRWSGLTLKALEERAVTEGNYSLPSSSLCDVLNGKKLPRIEILTAFVYACGLPEVDRRVWLETWVTLRGFSTKTQ